MWPVFIVEPNCLRCAHRLILWDQALLKRMVERGYEDQRGPKQDGDSVSCSLNKRINCKPTPDCGYEFAP
jgi:hypothetical protein